MLRTLVLAAVVSTLVACGGSPPDPAAPQPGAEPAASAKAPPASAESAPSAAEEPAPTAPPRPREEELRAAKSLDEPFPEIEAVTKELGPPTASGKAQRRQWGYDSEPRGTTFKCKTIDLIRMPSGAVAFDTSVMNSPDCKKLKTTGADVAAVLDDASGGAPDVRSMSIESRAARALGKKFDEVAALFEKRLGKPLDSGESELAAWRYTSAGVPFPDNQDMCRQVIVTSFLGPGVGQAIWDVSCD